jgi:hypothetical protein
MDLLKIKLEYESLFEFKNRLDKYQKELNAKHADEIRKIDNDTVYDTSNYNWTGTVMTFNDETSERFICIYLASMFERSIKQFLEVIKESNADFKIIKGGGYVEHVQKTLTKNNLKDYFEEIFTYWPILVRLRNMFVHNNSTTEGTIKKLSEELEKIDAGMVVADVGHVLPTASSEFYDSCMRDYLQVINKFCVILKKDCIFHEVSFNDGQEEDYRYYELEAFIG